MRIDRLRTHARLNRHMVDELFSFRCPESKDSYHLAVDEASSTINIAILIDMHWLDNVVSL